MRRTEFKSWSLQMTRVPLQIFIFAGTLLACAPQAPVADSLQYGSRNRATLKNKKKKDKYFLECKLRLNILHKNEFLFKHFQYKNYNKRIITTFHHYSSSTLQKILDGWVFILSIYFHYTSILLNNYDSGFT